MVYIMENPSKMDDEQGYPHFWKPPFDDLKIPEEIDEEIDHDRSQFTTWKYGWPGTLGHSSFPCQLS